MSVTENIDTSTPMGKFILTVFGAISELELSYIRENQREGIEAAKARGVYKGRKRIHIDPKKFKAVYSDWKAGKIKGVDAQKLLGLKANTFYRRVKEYENSFEKS